MPREINIEKIKTIEKDLLDTSSGIKTLIAVGESAFLKDQKNIYSLRYLLIEAVEAMANICNHILARITGQVPKGYPDCFEKLSDANVIKNDLADRLKKVTSLRNIIIHKYWEIDDSKIFKYTKENVGDFEEYLKQINYFIRTLK